jgi:hypothetical protein
MHQSLGNTILMPQQNQKEFAGLQPYSTLMVWEEYIVKFNHFETSLPLNYFCAQGHPTNHMYTYLQQQNAAMNSSQQGIIGTSTSTIMTGQNQAFFQQPKPN